MIDGMIAKLLDEAAAEASKKKWCDAEIAKTTQQKGVHDGWINKLTARLQECSAEIPLKQDEIAKNFKTLKDADAAAKKAT